MLLFEAGEVFDNQNGREREIKTEKETDREKETRFNKYYITLHEQSRNEKDSTISWPPKHVN